MKQLIIIVLLVSIAIRIIYLIQDPVVTINPDTDGYYNNAYHILHDSNPIQYITNDNRTPLYPLFVALTLRPDKYLDPFDPIPDSIEHNRWILLINMFLGIGTIIGILYCLSVFHLPSWIQTLIGLLVGTNPAILYFEHALLPETLSVFLLTISFALFIFVLRKSSPMWMLIHLFMGILLFLLRPIFIGIPILFIIFSMLYHKTRRFIITAIICLILYVGCIYGYMVWNSTLNGYFGINHTTDINFLGRIIELKIPYNDISGDQFFSDKLNEYKKISNDIIPFRFLEWSYGISEVYSNKPLLQNLQFFTRSVILKHPLEYLLKTIHDIPVVLMNSGLPAEESISPFLTILHGWIRYLSILFFAIIPYGFYSWIINFRNSKDKQFKPVIFLCMITIICYMLFSITFGAYNDSNNGMGRVFIPVFPLLFSAVGIGLYKFITWIKTQRFFTT